MDDVDAEFARFVVWSLFVAATMTAQASESDAIEAADVLLEATVKRFPFLAPPDPTGGLGPR